MIAYYAKAVLAVIIVVLIYVTGDPNVVSGLNETVEGILAAIATAGIVSQVPNSADPRG